MPRVRVWVEIMTHSDMEDIIDVPDGEDVDQWAAEWVENEMSNAMGGGWEVVAEDYEIDND